MRSPELCLGWEAELSGLKSGMMWMGAGGQDNAQILGRCASGLTYNTPPKTQDCDDGSKKRIWQIESHFLRRELGSDPKDGKVQRRGDTFLVQDLAIIVPLYKDCRVDLAA